MTPVGNGQRAARHSALSVLAVFLLAAGLLTPTGSLASETAPQPALQADEDGGWPRWIDLPEGTVVIYQPELEDFRGNDLKGRAAVSVTPQGEDLAVFGVVWFTARVQTDRDTRMIELVDLAVDRVRFPESSPAGERRLIELLERQVPGWNLSMSMDRIVASLALADRERQSAQGLSMDPPRILFVDYPAILVSIDGEARLEDTGTAGLRHIVNTPFTIVLDTGISTYYLYAGGGTWYAAPDLQGNWALSSSVPFGVAALAPQEEPLEGAQDPAETGPDPRIIVATEPTELIVTDGAPLYSPIAGTNLLYVTNSESDVVMELTSQRHFVILSGRWFAGAGLTGPWAHIAPEELPRDFARIPPESEMGHLLVSVPDTLESNEAVLDQQIPQTAAVDRTATTSVEYDGAPQFAPIEGTGLEYAINTSSQVLKADGRYFVLDEAVWFVADDPRGPWAVATERPAEVDEIPASCPMYNTKYVYVYDVTPTVVYMGYLPGYNYSYVYGGTVIYGTGYVYVPVYVPVYYPPPPTYGFHVRYNPWRGWSVGFSYSTGRFTFHIGYSSGGRWPPAGYHRYRRGYHRGWHRGYRSGFRAGVVASQPRVSPARNNMYKSPGNRARTVSRAPTAGQLPASPTSRPNTSNNVFSDRNGNVYRQGQDGAWQQRSAQGWQPSSSAPTSQLSQSSAARERGSTRTQSSRQSGSGSGRCQ